MKEAKPKGDSMILCKGHSLNVRDRNEEQISDYLGVTGWGKWGKRELDMSMKQ